MKNVIRSRRLAKLAKNTKERHNLLKANKGVSPQPSHARGRLRYGCYHIYLQVCDSISSNGPDTNYYSLTLPLF